MIADPTLDRLMHKTTHAIQRAAFRRHHPKKPLVSIITVIKDIVTHNRTASFKKMMRSIQRQSYGRNYIEHIIVDGGSQDGTLDILHTYEKKGWIDYWISEQDTGIYHAMNKGIAISTGVYVNFLNSDDYFCKHAIIWSVKALLHDKADYSFAKALLWGTKKPSDIQEGNVSRVLLGVPFNHQTLFVKRTCFEELGMFDESYTIAADHDFMFRLCMSNLSYAYVQKVIVYFHMQGISHCIHINEMERVWRTHTKNIGVDIKDYVLLRNCYLKKIITVQEKRQITALFLGLAKQDISNRQLIKFLLFNIRLQHDIIQDYVQEPWFHFDNLSFSRKRWYFWVLIISAVIRRIQHSIRVLWSVVRRR